ncbi:MAG: beta-glucosidase [Psychromonas sp.]|jgi:beta-glucosidase
MQMDVENVVGSENIITELSDANENTVAILVIGKDPYAEMFGDIKTNKILAFSAIKPSYLADLHKLKELTLPQ